MLGVSPDLVVWTTQQDFVIGIYSVSTDRSIFSNNTAPIKTGVRALQWQNFSIKKRQPFILLGQ
jgi:hypothetical protein